MRAAGASSFVVPIPTLTDTDVAGLWVTINDPVAINYNGKTYVTWADDSKHVWAGEYADGALTATDLGIINDAVDGAIHLCPAITIRDSDKRVLVAAVANGGTNRPGIWTSTNPEDATSFGAVSLFGTSGSYTYSTIHQLTGVNGQPLYYFTGKFASGIRYLMYAKSTNGGVTWTDPAPLIAPASTSSNYWRIGTDGDRLDIFVTDTDRVASPSSVFHFYVESDNLYDSAGALVGAISAGPYAADDGTLVQDDAYGPARCTGWAYDEVGRPAALTLITSGGSTTIARVARWNGTAWVTHAVTGADSGGFVGGNQFIGSGAMDKRDPNTVYFPQKVGARFEMFRYRSHDEGARWSGTALTASSGADHAMPDTPTGSGSALAVWGLGSYTSDSNFDFDIQVWGLV